MNMNVYMYSDHMLAFGSILYIRYNTGAHIVNSTCNNAVHDVVDIKLNIIYILANAQYCEVSL